MKITVEKCGTKYRLRVKQGVQSFYLSVGQCASASKTDCLWFAKMFRHALKEHDKDK